MKIIDTFKASWSSPDIRRRIFITIFIILSFRILAAVPVPGINRDIIKNFYNSPAGGGLQFLNTFAGGTLDTFSILSVGLIPFINASVIFQLLPTIIKKLENMQKEGEIGRKRLTQFTRLLTVPLAILTSITIFITLKTQGLITIDDPLRIVSIVTVLTAGAIFMMWLGEIMTEKGIGNGISILIMVGILASIPPRFLQQITAFKTWEAGIQFAIATVVTLIVALLLLFMLKSANNIKKWWLRLLALGLGFTLITTIIVTLIIPVEVTSMFNFDRLKSFGKLILDTKGQVPVQLGMILALAMVVIGLIVLFNEAAKNLPIYFSRKASTSALVAKKSFMPLKLLQAGVMPIIFANALLLFPYTISVIVTRFNVQVDWIKSTAQNIINFLEPQDWRYWLLNFLFTVFFAYFYTFVLFRPTQVSENLKKSGSYVPGIRPGLETEKFLTRTMLHLVFAGAMVLGVMATSQAFIGGGLKGVVNTNNQTLLSTIFTSGTSLLIVVGVALDTRRQFKSYLAQRNYDELFDDLDKIGNVTPTGEVTNETKKFAKIKRLPSKIFRPIKALPLFNLVKKK